MSSPFFCKEPVVSFKIRCNRSKRAYTLIEIMVVLSIISVLLGAGIYYMKDTLGMSKEVRVSADLNVLKTCLLQYQIKARGFPTTAQGLSALVVRPTIHPIPARWTSVLGASALIDPWNHPYKYTCPGKHNPSEFDIYSVGQDGIEGTEDDIGNWSDSSPR